jgi:hypothetical protein
VLRLSCDRPEHAFLNVFARYSQVTTGNLNLAVKRNRIRFPADFMFQLTKDENALVLQSAIAKKGRGGRQTLPYAFTELDLSKKT